MRFVHAISVPVHLILSVENGGVEEERPPAIIEGVMAGGPPRKGKPVETGYGQEEEWRLARDPS
jgi:hypothetical protein